MSAALIATPMISQRPVANTEKAMMPIIPPVSKSVASFSFTLGIVFDVIKH